jgi:hypothetical protein
MVGSIGFRALTFLAKSGTAMSIDCKALIFGYFGGREMTILATAAAALIRRTEG